MFEQVRIPEVLFLNSFSDAIFCENTEPRSLQDKQKGAKKTFEEMMNYIPGIIFDK